MCLRLFLFAFVSLPLESVATLLNLFVCCDAASASGGALVFWVLAVTVIKLLAKALLPTTTKHTYKYNPVNL